MNSSLDSNILACTSHEEVITPHLFAEESLTMVTPAWLNKASRASGVVKMLAPESE